MSTEIVSNSTSSKKAKPSANVMRPIILVLFVISILLTSILSIVFGHKFGYQKGLRIAQENVQIQNENSSLTTSEINALNTRVQTLDQQLSTAKQELDISLNNLGVMRIDLEELDIENLQLKQLVKVYEKQLSKRGGLPLQIIGEKIEPLPENAFEYRFDVAMFATDNKEHRLVPKLTLLTEESLVEVPLEPSRYDIKGVARIRGRFVMPEGFTPKQARLVLKSNGQEVDQIYDWKTASPVDKMPISLAEIPEPDERPISD